MWLKGSTLHFDGKRLEVKLGLLTDENSFTFNSRILDADGSVVGMSLGVSISAGRIKTEIKPPAR